MKNNTYIRYRSIISEFDDMRNRGVRPRKAFQRIANEHDVAEKTVQNIVYNKNIYREILNKEN